MIQIRFIAFVGGLALLVILGRLFELQILEKDHWSQVAASRHVDIKLVPYNRGKILLQNGKVLAKNIQNYYLVSTVDNIYPKYAELVLFLDQLDSKSRENLFYNSPKDFPDISFLRNKNDKLFENVIKLLYKWNQSPGKIRIRIARDLTRSQVKLLRARCGNEFNDFVSFRAQEEITGLKKQYELWFSLPSGVQPSEKSVVDMINMKSNFSIRNLFTEFGMIISHRNLGKKTGSMNLINSALKELNRSFAVEKEVLLLDNIDEDEGPRLKRYVALRRNYFQGLIVRSKKEGGFFNTRRQYTISLRNGYEDVFAKISFLFSKSGYGNHALQREFLKNCSRNKILERLKRLLNNTNELYKIQYRQKLKKYSAYTAWELAEAWRSRCLEIGLFSIEFPVIRDFFSNDADTRKLLSLIPDGAKLRFRKHHIRQYLSGEDGELIASIVGIAKEWQNTKKWKTSGRPNYESTEEFLKDFWKTPRKKKGVSIEELFHERRNSQPELRMPDELTGITGFEAVMDNTLRGSFGLEADLDAKKYCVAPLNGKDYKLTLDLELTRILYKTIKEKLDPALKQKGFAIVMDLKNGDLLSLASYPSYDPQRYANDPSYCLWIEKHYSPEVAPLRNHCLYPAIPGSVFKLFIASAYLEEGGSENLSIDCFGNSNSPTFHCPTPGHGAGINLIRAIKVSCNTYFIFLGTRKLGSNKFATWIDRLGFNDRRSRLNSLVNGFLPLTSKDLPREECYTVEFLKNYNRLSIMSYGSGPTNILPLVLIRLVGAIANGGTVPRPRILSNAPIIKDRCLKAKTCRIIRTGMRKVVNEKGGTAFSSGLKVFNVACKTGTAELNLKTRINNAWIAGFIPVKKPRFAFLVCLEKVKHGSHGGNTAGPVMIKALDYLDKKYPGLGLKR